MMEKIMYNIILSWIFFSVLEYVIVTYYYIKDNNIMYNLRKTVLFIVFISILHTILYLLLPKPILPLFVILYTSLIYSMFFKVYFIRSLISTTKVFIIFLIIEVIFSILLQYIWSIDVSQTNSYIVKYYLSLPIKIIQFLFIILLKNKGGENMGTWFWGLVKPNQKKETETKKEEVKK